MQKKYLQWSLYLAGLFVLLVASVVLSLSVGEMNLGFMDIFSILRKGHESMEYTILSQPLPAGTTWYSCWRGAQPFRHTFAGSLSQSIG